MLRTTTTIRTLLLLGGIGAAIAATEPAAAQGTPCIPGYYYSPVYGCLVAGEAYLPLPYILPHHDYAHPYHPYHPSSGFSPQGHMAGGLYAPQHSFSPHVYVPAAHASSGLSMGHSGMGGGSFGHSSFGGGGFGGGGFGGGGHGR
jgi:uncharacterized membrane protein YgcG